MIVKVVLDHLEGDSVQEVVHAKFLIGADGEPSSFTDEIYMLTYHRCALMGAQSPRHTDGRRTDE